jgi:hypothetical protein
VRDELPVAPAEEEAGVCEDVHPSVAVGIGQVEARGRVDSLEQVRGEAAVPIGTERCQPLISPWKKAGL